MGKLNFDLISFNRGVLSPLALARVDVERTRLSSETQINWTPKTQGAMRLRPGSKYLGSSKSDAEAAWIEFVAATSDTALLELTDGVVRVWVDDELVSRPSVSTTIATITSSSGWTNSSTSGGTATFAASGLTLNGVSLGGIALVTRQITVASGDQNVEHGLAIEITRGPVTFRVGSTLGGDDYIGETSLRTGRHSLAFTPTGDFYLSFRNEDPTDVIVASIAVEASGVMEVATPWAAANLDDIRYDQSADVVFVACSGVRQMRIERRGSGRSWSVVNYVPSGGPFFLSPSSTALMKPGATYGDTTLTASRPFFTASHVGALFRVFHTGQGGSYKFGAADTYSDVWAVSGLGSTTERRTTIVTSGTFSANIRVQRSYNNAEEGFRTVTTITTATSTNVDDSDDNITVWYRLAIPVAADYTSGTVTAAVTYAGGGKDGVCRVTGYTSPTSVNIAVLSRFSDTVNSDDWAEEYWSDAAGYPSSVGLHEGRMMWFGGSQMFASVSDDYENFDANTEGDSGPFIRSIGRGPVDRINFAAPLQRLLIGTSGSEYAIQSSSFEEPLTPTNANAKPISTQGSMNLRSVQLDSTCVFVQRAGKRLFMLAFDVNQGNYSSQELTLLVPDFLAEGVVSIAIQRQPDTRIHCVLGDGTVAILTYEEQEQVLCWTLNRTTAASGKVRQAMVLPGSDEDQVYYHVERSIDGSTVRYLERQATEAESVGGAVSWMADCAVSYTGAAATSITGLDHLEGEEVIAWADGVDLSPDDDDGIQRTYTVSGGAITLDDAQTNVVAGLPYTERAGTANEMDAFYRSTKLAYGAAAGTALTMPKRVDHLGLILGTTHNNGLFFGKDFDHLFPLPRIINARPVTDEDEIYPVSPATTLDLIPSPFTGDFDTDSRICLAAKAPRPATLLAGVIGMATNDVV